MKVLVINPPNKPFTEKSLLIEPVDVLATATYAQSQGHKVKVVDMDIKQQTPESIEETVSSFKPEVTIVPFDYHIPLHTSEAIEGVKQIGQIAKQFGSRTLIGGKTPKHYPASFLENGFDVVANTHMEVPLDALLKSSNWSEEHLSKVNGITYLSDGRVINNEFNSSLNLNYLPIADRSLVNLGDYIDVRGIWSSRGCASACGFCPSTKFWNGWSGRSADDVVDEIDLLSTKYGAKKIMFLDDNATADKSRIERISKKLAERGIAKDVMLGALGTVQIGQDQKTLQTMYNGGFRWIHFGAESGSEKVLKNVCKSKNPDAIRSAINRSKDIGFRVRTSWIYDLPGTDGQAIEETNNLILETGPDEIRIHYLVPRAGTAFQEPGKGNTIPTQYIHHNKPQGTVNRDVSELTSGVERLINTLQDRGYLVVNNISEWEKIAKMKNPRFISFCPSRYGVGWEK